MFCKSSTLSKGELHKLVFIIFEYDSDALNAVSRLFVADELFSSQNLVWDLKTLNGKNQLTKWLCFCHLGHDVSFILEM